MTAPTNLRGQVDRDAALPVGVAVVVVVVERLVPDVADQRDLADIVVDLVDDVPVEVAFDVVAAARVGYAERLVTQADAPLQLQHLPVERGVELGGVRIRES